MSGKAGGYSISDRSLAGGSYLCAFLQYEVISATPAGGAESEFQNLRFERGAVLGGYLAAAAHGTNRRLQLAATRILGGLSGADQRLLADDQQTTDLLDPQLAISDYPVAGN